jgi:alpha-1,2-mannosyltransferase
LFVAAALALMPYGLALAVWQAVTLGLYLLTIGAILKAFSPENGGAIRRNPLWLLVALAFPAVLINIGHSQNGFLTAALLGGALVCSTAVRSWPAFCSAFSCTSRDTAC